MMWCCKFSEAVQRTPYISSSSTAQYRLVIFSMCCIGIISRMVLIFGAVQMQGTTCTIVFTKFINTDNSPGKLNPLQICSSEDDYFVSIYFSDLSWHVNWIAGPSVHRLGVSVWRRPVLLFDPSRPLRNCRNQPGIAVAAVSLRDAVPYV